LNVRCSPYSPCSSISYFNPFPNFETAGNKTTNKHSSAWNTFDFFVTTTSVLEVILSGTGRGPQALRVLRLFRVIRTFRMIRNFPTLHVVVQAIGASSAGIMATFILLVIYMFVFAVIGAQVNTLGSLLACIVQDIRDK
jgi:hypothetical protein